MLLGKFYKYLRIEKSCESLRLPLSVLGILLAYFQICDSVNWTRIYKFRWFILFHAISTKRNLNSTLSNFTKQEKLQQVDGSGRPAADAVGKGAEQR